MLWVSFLGLIRTSPNTDVETRHDAISFFATIDWVDEKRHPSFRDVAVLLPHDHGGGALPTGQACPIDGLLAAENDEVYSGAIVEF